MYQPFLKCSSEHGQFAQAHRSRKENRASQLKTPSQNPRAMSGLPQQYESDSCSNGHIAESSSTTRAFSTLQVATTPSTAESTNCLKSSVFHSVLKTGLELVLMKL